MLEQSQAVKCPPISHHLCTLKRIQQVFSNPNVLERYAMYSYMCINYQYLSFDYYK